jgi:5-methylthioribose kinase
MFELTAENAAEYLRAPAKVEELSGGVSGVVLRVTTPERKFVIKQARPQLRTKAAWFSDRDRIWREMEVMHALGPLLPTTTVPRILFHDRDNYLFAMTHAPEPFQVWKAALLAGSAQPETASLVGEVLGRIHETTAGNAQLREQFADVKIFDQLRIEPFYRTVQRRCPDVAPLIEPIVERMYYVKDAICHGDYTPKNILVHDDGFTLVDYETAYYGDPTMDVGLLLAHLLLKVFRTSNDLRFAMQPPSLVAAMQVIKAYAASVTYRPPAEWEPWSIEHCAACLLARIDGTSLVDYLDEEQRVAVRQLARQLLFERPAHWFKVWKMVGAAFENLTRHNP